MSAVAPPQLSPAGAGVAATDFRRGRRHRCRRAATVSVGGDGIRRRLVVLLAVDGPFAAGIISSLVR